MKNYIMNYFKINPAINNSIFLIVGFLVVIPLFIIPNFPFFHLNVIYKDVIWVVSNVHPAYTYSLGLAIPANVVVIIIFLLMFNYKKIYELGRVDLINSSVILFSLMVLGVLSGSISSLKIVVVFITFFFILKSKKSFKNKSFVKGFIVGWYFLVFSQASTNIFLGLEFSQKMDGISILGLEIYQALVGYSAILAIVIGTAMLNQKLFLLSSKVSSSFIFSNTLYFSFIILGLFNIFVMGRRSALIIISISLFLLIIKKLYNKKILFICFLSGLATLIIFISFFLYQGVEALNYQHALLPRLNIYSTSIASMWNVSLSHLLFGFSDGWGTRHNLPLDLIYHSGLVGLFVFLLLLIFTFRVNGKSNIYLLFYFFKIRYISIIFIILAFTFDNLININLYLPYYSICVLLLLLASFEHLKEDK